jgi:ABC-type microcin C transport system permease subunit YejB
MVGIGRLINVQGELYEIQETLKVNPHKPIPSDVIDEIKKHYGVDKAFKKENILYLVNEVTTIEPIDD